MSPRGRRLVVLAEETTRTSRAGDPALHSHVLVANLAAGPDGRWTALDARHLYREGRTAGFGSAIRKEFSQRSTTMAHPPRPAPNAPNSDLTEKLFEVGLLALSPQRSRGPQPVQRQSDLAAVRGRRLPHCIRGPRSPPGDEAKLYETLHVMCHMV